MTVPILVVTPNAGFGELVGQILSETGDYVLSMAVNPDDALAMMAVQKPALLLLELDQEVEAVKELLEQTSGQSPKVLLILIASEALVEEGAFESFQPDGVLAKPVYLPDLVSKVEEVIENSEMRNIKLPAPAVKTVQNEPPASSTEVDQAPVWLSDVNLAAQHLTRLTLESASQASLITRGDKIWAYAGELPRPAAEELARTVSEHFTNGGGSDLARFIRLEQTGGEYMLYATGLGGDYVLSAVFDAEMPFSKIRAQASNLAVALSTPPPQEEDQEVEVSEDEDEFDDESQPMALWPLLDDVPPPIPNDWVPETKLKKTEEESLLDELLDDALQDEFSSETVAVPSFSRPAIQDGPTQPEGEETAAAAQSTPPDGQMDETQESHSRRYDDPDDLPELEDEFEVEPVSPSMYNLTYACVLIPRFPHHHLTGEMAKRLTDWITHLCVAFGWRLEMLSVRPEYMQWLVNVPPNTSPGYLMRTIREHTSRRMFVEFPETEADNPSGDFWAPGYLILGSPQPPPASLIQEFMQNTRTRQGLQDERPS